MQVLRTRSGRNASQRADELLPFIALLKERGVTSYLEIGARHGDTFYHVMRSLPRGSRGLAIDMPGGAWGTIKSVQSLMAAVNDLDACGYEVSTVMASSQLGCTVTQARKLAPFGAILIDGDHRYAGVKSDWELYGQMAPIVAFHDIVGDGQADAAGNKVEVPRLWSELKAGHKTIEFVGPDSLMGIGVVLH
jgi:hypothetical protein